MVSIHDMRAIRNLSINPPTCTPCQTLTLSLSCGRKSMPHGNQIEDNSTPNIKTLTSMAERRTPGPGSKDPLLSQQQPDPLQTTPRETVGGIGIKQGARHVSGVTCFFRTSYSCSTGNLLTGAKTGVQS